MQKEELIQFINDFYDNRLKYAIIYGDNAIHAIRKTDDLMRDGKGYIHFLTYGCKIDGQWNWKIHEYEYGETCVAGIIEFFKSYDEAIQRGQEIVNKIAENSYLTDSVFKHWIDLGLHIPEVALERKNKEFIEREERLSGELQELKKCRSKFFKKFCK